MAESDSAWKHITIYLYIVMGIFIYCNRYILYALLFIYTCPRCPHLTQLFT